MLMLAANNVAMVMAVCMDAAASPGISESESYGYPTYPRHSVCKIYSQETLLKIRVMQAAKTMMNGCDLAFLHSTGSY